MDACVEQEGNSDASQGPSRRQAIFLTLLACAVIVALMDWLCRFQINSLDLPETAMNGMKRVTASTICFLIFGSAAIILGYLTLRPPYSQIVRKIALIPALAISAALFFYLRSTAEIAKAPALHGNFASSECDLDSLADEIATGQHPNMPQQVGHFLITGYEVLGDGKIALFTKAKKEGWSRWGFIRDNDQAADTGPASLMGMSDVVGEINRIERLSGRWFLIYDHYYLVKVGWS